MSPSPNAATRTWNAVLDGVAWETSSRYEV